MSGAIGGVIDFNNLKINENIAENMIKACLLYTSDAADERSSVDLGGRRIIKKKKTREHGRRHLQHHAKNVLNNTPHQQLEYM